MPAYKRQHWLPAVYLKQFSCEGVNARRKSMIWRLDETDHREVRVDSQCVGDYFYSATDPRDTEEMFGRFESSYGQIMKKIWNCGDSTTRDYFGLILMMFDLHCRNASYDNQTGDENIKAYKVRIQCLRNELLMGRDSEIVSDHDLWDFLRTTWRVRVLNTAVVNELVTSDNPSIWFSLDETLGLHLMALPLTPSMCAIAYDSRACTVFGTTLTVQDEALLNCHQVDRGEILYTPHQLTPEQRDAVWQNWCNRERPIGNVDKRRWTVNIQRLNASKLPDFLTRG